MNKNVWQLKKGDAVVVEGTIRYLDCMYNYKIGPHDIYTLVFSDGTKIEEVSDWTSFEVKPPATYLEHTLTGTIFNRNTP